MQSPSVGNNNELVKSQVRWKTTDCLSFATWQRTEQNVCSLRQADSQDGRRRGWKRNTQFLSDSPDKSSHFLRAGVSEGTE